MARTSILVNLFLIAFLFLNPEYLVHAAPTSSPLVPSTNTSALVVPGDCEVFPPGECQSFTSDECVNDQQCQDIYLDYPGLKCCRNYCGIRVCDLPINIPAISVESHEVREEIFTEYVCPVDKPQAECPKEEDFDNECVQDSECAEQYPGSGYKCCKDSCGDRFCAQPVQRVVRRRIVTGHGIGGISNAP